MLNLSRQESLRRRYKQEHPGYRTSGELYQELLDTYVTPRSVVLDAGCGEAGVVERLERVAEHAVGIDRTFGDYRHAVKARDLVKRRLEDLPFRPNSFDVISCTYVLEHLEQPQRVFREFARILRPGGVLLCLAPNAANYVTLINRLVPNRLHGRIVPRLYGRAERFVFPLYYRANTKRALDEGLGRCGFLCECFRYVGDPTYIAFNELLYRLGVLLEGFTDSEATRRFKVHFVAVYRYRG